MDRQTLVNYGWIVIASLVLAVMLTLATPFGKYVMDGVSSVASGYINASNNAMSDTNKQELADEWADKWVNAECGIPGHNKTDGKVHGVPVTECNSDHSYTCECSVAKMMSYGTYYVGVTSTTVGDYATATHVYEANEEMPCGYTPKQGDIFVYGDYEYRYKMSIGENDFWITRGTDGWGVRVLDITKTKYSDPLDNVFGKNVTYMYRTYKNCVNMTVAPKIPNNTTYLFCTYEYCKNLTTLSEIPETVVAMQGAYRQCVNLTTTPTIPKGVKNLRSTFADTKITKMPEIPEGVTDMYATFAFCQQLKESTKIPSTVTTLEKTFWGCRKLQSAPEVPSSVTNMHKTFAECKSLIGEIRINATPEIYEHCLTNVNMNNVTITGVSETLKNALIDTVDDIIIYDNDDV